MALSGGVWESLVFAFIPWTPQVTGQRTASPSPHPWVRLESSADSPVPGRREPEANVGRDPAP